MKKLILTLAVIFSVATVSIACENKGEAKKCCKKDDKKACASKAEGCKKGAKACCKSKKAEATAPVEAAPAPAAH